MFIALEKDLRVNFVRDDQPAVADHDLAHTDLFFPVPQASHRVLRIAEYNSFGPAGSGVQAVLRAESFFQILVVHLVTAIDEFEGVIGDLAAAVGNRPEEWEIDRLLQYHFIAGTCEGPHRHI